LKADLFPGLDKVVLEGIGVEASFVGRGIGKPKICQKAKASDNRALCQRVNREAI
jgi:hypothetical protein